MHISKNLLGGRAPSLLGCIVRTEGNNSVEQRRVVPSPSVSPVLQVSYSPVEKSCPRKSSKARTIGMKSEARAS